MKESTTSVAVVPAAILEEAWQEVGASFERFCLTAGISLLCKAAAPPTGISSAAPKCQLAVAHSGVWFRLGPFVLGRHWIAMKVIIENRRDRPVYVAAFERRGASGELETALSDDSGTICMSESSRAGDYGYSKGRRAAGTMTSVPPHSRMDIGFYFADCRLSSTSTLSFSGQFALATNRDKPQPITVLFRGIAQKTTIP